MTEIRRFRRERKLPVKVVAEKAGISPMTLYRYESGKRVPDVNTAKKIAVILGTTVDALIEGGEKE